MRLRTCLVLLLTAVTLRAEVPPDGDGLGGFTGRSVTFHNLLRPHDTTEPFGSREPGDTHASLSVSYGNIFADDHFLVDGEWLLADVRVSHTIAESLALGILAPFSSRSGGFMDGFIEEFHNLVGLGQQGREAQPRDETSIRGITGGTPFNDTHASSGANDPVLFASWHAVPGGAGRPSITVEPRVSFPAGDEDDYEGLGEPAYGLGVVAAQRLGTSRHYLYLGIDYSRTDAEEVKGFRLKQDLFAGSLTWEYRRSPDLSWLVEHQVVSGLTRGLGEWDEEAHHFTLGFKRVLESGVTVACGVQQNIFRYENSTDLGFRFALFRAL